MKALRISRRTSLQELTLSEIPEPQPVPGQVRVRLRAAALNHRDLGMFDWEPDTNFVLGADGSGVVDAVGQGVDPQVLGSEVLINPSLNWGERQDAFAEGFAILGWPGDGTFAEAVVVPASNAVPKPTYLSFEEAAAVPLAGLTAYRAVNTRAQVRPGEQVLIHGIGGGVAQFALRLAKCAGARVLVTSTSDEKVERAFELGADLAINSGVTDWKDAASRWTKGNGVDVVVDSVGGELFAESLLVLRRGGRIVTYGTTADALSTVDLSTIFWHQLTILGSTMGSPEDFARMIETVTAHRIRPVIDSVWSLAEGPLALQRLAQGLQFGKIVLRCS